MTTYNFFPPKNRYLHQRDSTFTELSYTNLNVIRRSYSNADVYLHVVAVILFNRIFSCFFFQDGSEHLPGSFKK